MSVKRSLSIPGWLRKKFWTVLSALLLVLNLLPDQPVQAGGTIRVIPQGAAVSGCGSSWASGCSLMYALQIAQPGDQIWVQAGAYIPGTSRNATFQLVTGVAVYGGFLGSETSLSQRSWKDNPTLLSGNIGDVNSSADNAYHVVTAAGVDSTAILDGFTIREGNANGAPPFDTGGGLYVNGAAPTLANLTITENYAIYGGGLFASGANYHLSDSTFLRNKANNGAGIYHTSSSSPTLVNVFFFGNVATSSGGAMYNNNNAAPDISNAVIAGNSAPSAGGFYNTNSRTYLRNATLVGNPGGAFYSSFATQSTTNATLVNTIAWANGANPFYINRNTPTIRRSLLENGCPTFASCNYILLSDPQLARMPSPGDDGQWGTTDDDYGDLRLLANSPVIDAGDNQAVAVSTDAAGNPRFVDNPGVVDTGIGTPPLVDFGAYENTVLASKTRILSTNPVPSFVGQKVSVFFEVTGSNGTPSGPVIVSDGTHSCTATVATGFCQITFSTIGDKTLVASYPGDILYQASQSEPFIHHKVYQASAKVSLVLDPEPSILNQQVHAAFRVTSTGAGQPTGIVYVYVNKGSDITPISSCFATLADGSCLLDFPGGVGSYLVTALYLGDDNFYYSYSPTITHKVDSIIYTTTRILSVQPEPSVVGQPITIAFQTTATQGTPDGVVTVSDGTNQCEASVSAGSCQITYHSAGNYSLVASYAGNSTLSDSKSNSYAHTVSPAQTKISLSASSPLATPPGETIHVEYTLEVPAPGAGSPTGSVEISDGTHTWTSDVSQTRLDLTLNEPGGYTLTAHYLGDSNYLPSISPPLIHPVGFLFFLPLTTN